MTTETFQFQCYVGTMLLASLLIDSIQAHELCNNPKNFGRQILVFGQASKMFVLISKKLNVYRFDGHNFAPNFKLNLANVESTKLKDLYPNLANNDWFKRAQQNDSFLHTLVRYDPDVDKEMFTFVTASVDNDDRFNAVTYDAKSDKVSENTWQVAEVNFAFILDKRAAWISCNSRHFVAMAPDAKLPTFNYLYVAINEKSHSLEQDKEVKDRYDNWRMCTTKDGKGIRFQDWVEECQYPWKAWPLLMGFIGHEKVYLFGEQEVYVFASKAIPGMRDFKSSAFVNLSMAKYTEFLLCGKISTGVIILILTALLLLILLLIAAAYYLLRKKATKGKHKRSKRSSSIQSAHKRNHGSKNLNKHSRRISSGGHVQATGSKHVHKVSTKGTHHKMSKKRRTSKNSVSRHKTSKRLNKLSTKRTGHQGKHSKRNKSKKGTRHHRKVSTSGKLIRRKSTKRTVSRHKHSKRRSKSAQTVSAKGATARHKHSTTKAFIRRSRS